MRSCSYSQDMYDSYLEAPGPPDGIKSYCQVVQGRMKYTLTVKLWTLLYILFIGTNIGGPFLFIGGLCIGNCFHSHMIYYAHAIQNTLKWHGCSPTAFTLPMKLPWRIRVNTANASSSQKSDCRMQNFLSWNVCWNVARLAQVPWIHCCYQVHLCEIVSILLVSVPYIYAIQARTSWWPAT